MSYEVEIAPAAKRQIKKLPHDVQQKVVAKIKCDRFLAHISQIFLTKFEKNLVFLRKYSY